MQTLALHDHAARRWEPKRLRLRIFSLAGVLAATARTVTAHLSARSPWADLGRPGPDPAPRDHRRHNHRLTARRARLSVPTTPRIASAVEADDARTAHRPPLHDMSDPSIRINPSRRPNPPPNTYTARS